MEMMKNQENENNNDPGWVETEQRMSHHLISSTMHVQSNFSPVANKHTIFFETPALELLGSKNGNVLATQSVRKEELKSLSWIEAQRKDGMHGRIESYWAVVQSIVGIYRQSDGSGGVEKDESHLYEEITEFDVEYLRKRGILSPSDPYRLAWDGFTGIFVLYTALEVPFRIAFLLTADPSVGALVVEYIIVSVFFCDIAANFCTGYIDAKTLKLVYNHRRIAERYCMVWFWFDLISTMPFEAMAASSSSASDTAATLKMFRLVRLFRFVKLAKILQTDTVRRFLEFLKVPDQLMSMVKLVLVILLSGHIFGCFWWFMTTTAATGVVQPSCDHLKNKRCAPVTYVTWATEFGYQWEDYVSQYVASIYYTFATLLTVGYGDIHAVNVSERIFATFLMLSGAMTFGAIIAGIKSIIESNDLLGREVIEQTNVLKEFLVEKSIPTQLTLDSLDAFVYSLENRPLLSDSGLYDIVPFKIKLQILKQQFTREVALIDILRRSSFAFTAILLEGFMPVQVEGGEIIYESGDVADELSFLYRGKVRLIQVDELRTDQKKETMRLRTVTGIVHAGGLFGDFEFVSHGTRVVRYSALQSCKMYSVSYERLRRAIEEQPAAGQRFLMEIKKRRESFVSQLVLHKTFVHTKSRGSPISGDYSPGAAAMVHDMNILQSMDSMDGERSPILSVNSKERRLRRSSGTSGGSSLRASPSQNILHSVSSPRGGTSPRGSPVPSSGASPTTTLGHPTNRSSPLSPLFQRISSSSDVMDHIPPPRALADRYPGMSSPTTPTHRSSEKDVPSSSDGTKKPLQRYSSEKGVPGTASERAFSADEIVERLMRNQSQDNKIQNSNQPKQGSTNDNVGSMMDDGTTTTTTTATTTTTNHRLLQPTTIPNERSKKRASPTPMILERRGSFKFRTNEMGLPLSNAGSPQQSRVGSITATPQRSRVGSTTATPQRSRAGSIDVSNATNLLLLKSTALLQGGDNDDEEEELGSRPVSYREAHPLPYGPLVRLNVPVDAPPALPSAPAPGQGLVFIPPTMFANEMYTGGISMAPMTSSPRRPRSARIDPHPPGCLPSPRDKRTAKGSSTVSFDKSPSSSQKERVYQPSNNYPPPPPPFPATKEPASPVSYGEKKAGASCQDLDRNEDCDDCCNECCVPSHHRHRRRHRSAGYHHHDHHDYYIHYNPQIWVDGDVRDTVDSDKIEPINNYLTQLFPMVKTNPQGKHYPPIVVDDNMESLKKDHIIHPYGLLKILWDTFIGILIVYSITEIPMIVAFRSLESSRNGYNLQIFDWIVDGFFFIDMLQAWHVAYYSEEYDADVVIREMIAIHYVKFWFWVDLASCFPFSTVVRAADPTAPNTVYMIQFVKIIRLIRLGKLVKILNVRKRLDYIFAHTNTHPAFLLLITILFKVIMVSHFVACIWWGMCDAITTNAWFNDVAMVGVNLENSPFSDQYSTSIYWAITTLTATGYGDIVPVNTSERIVACIAFIVGASVFGYVTANVVDTVGAFGRGEQITNFSVYKIGEYLKMFNIQQKLRIDVITHSRAVLRFKSVYDEEMLFSRLPPNLRVDILAHISRDVIKNIRLFDFIRNRSMRVLVLGIMQREYAIAGRPLCVQGEPCQKVVFLIQGTAAVLRQSKRRLPFTPTPSKDEIARKAAMRLTANFEKFQHIDVDDDVKDHMNVGDEGDGSEEDQSHLELLTEMHPGEFVGHEEFTLSLPYTTQVMAVEKCCYYTLSKGDINELISTHEDAAFELQAALGQLFYDAEIHSVPRKNKSKRALFIDELKSLVAPNFRPSTVVEKRLSNRRVSGTKKGSAHCCKQIKSPPRLSSRANPNIRIPPPPPINSTTSSHSSMKIDGSNMITPWAQSSSLPPSASSFSSSISWYAGGVDPQNPKSLDLFHALQRIQRYLDLPEVSIACDRLRERFVNECGPGGTDKPMQLKRHRSFGDFVLLKARETSVFRRRTMMASHAMSPMIHGLHSVQENAKEGDFDYEEEEDEIFHQYKTGKKMKKRFSFPNNS